jgi:hypothetical protein
MTDLIHESHNIRKDDDERYYCVLCAAYTAGELAAECTDLDPLEEAWLDDDDEEDWSEEDE